MLFFLQALSTLEHVSNNYTRGVIISLRDNLDPLNEHSDAECLDALARVHLNSFNAQRSSSEATSRSLSLHGDRGQIIRSSASSSETATHSDLENKFMVTLDTPVSAGGQNFSNGQRQLLGMARTLLRQGGVVIMDEATSSIDQVSIFNKCLLKKGPLLKS